MVWLLGLLRVTLKSNIYNSQLIKPYFSGVGAILKTWARQETRNNPIGNPIRNIEGFYNGAVEKFANMKLFLVSSEQIDEIAAKMNIEERMKFAKTISGTHRLHHFCSIDGSKTELKVKPVSNLDDSYYKIVKVLD